MTEAGAVRVERLESGVEVWTLDRPERRNALDRATVRRLALEAHRVRGDRAVRAVVITGAGEKAFSAGADLKERRGMDEVEVRAFLDAWRAAFGAIDRLPVPTVAAIDGVALGGGFELALACDFRVASRGAVMGLPEVTLAIVPGAGGTQRLTRLMGPARAKELILLGRRISAEEALSLGVLNRLADEGEGALGCALRFVEPLAQGAPVAIAAALEAVDAALDLPLEAGLEVERRAYERTLGTRDRLEALAAFQEKRRPRFTGA